MQYGPYFNFYLFPPSAAKYGQVALNDMDKHGIYTDSKLWRTTKKQVLTKIKTKKNYKQVLPLLNKAIKTAGGKHSSILTKSSREMNSKFSPPTIKYSDNILYIHEPEFSGSAKQGNAYANQINEALQKTQTSKVILDLSNNTGGDMGPMIGGISSLLPNGEIFSFVSQSGKATAIKLFGSMINAGSSTIKVNHPQKLSHRKIAVIINNLTASSGELTALSLWGLSNVRYFGTASAGYTSVNQTFTLFDGTQMNLTTNSVRTRNGKNFLNDKIEPDQFSNSPVKSATDWLTR
ncbi:nisin-resistance protein [Liquorilactobacillus sucicola DSM 21376 = JCM 15457]|nr:nisin-resistance protein [Liquorilactobacillus sucicola DSM 21376 = JCM 15457]